jgi:hypothetical protein
LIAWGVLLMLGATAARGQAAGGTTPSSVPKLEAGRAGEEEGAKPAAEARVMPARVSPNQPWFVIPYASPSGEKTAKGEPVIRSVLLFHVPPRGGSKGAADGTLRRGGEVVQTPASWCVRGRSLFMLFEDEPPPPAFKGSPKPRQLLTIRAVRGEDGDWETDPAGRPNVLPSLDGAGTLIDMVGSDVGIFVLRHVDDALRLDLLNPDAPDGSPKWMQVEGLAPQLHATESRLAVAGYAKGVLIAEGSDGAGRLWTVNCEGATPTWTERALGEPGADAVRHERSGIAVCAGQLAAFYTDKDGALHVMSRAVDGAGLPSGPWRELSTQANFGDMLGVGPLDEDERLVFLHVREVTGVTTTPSPKTAPRPETELRLLELGVRTGRVLYDGPLKLAPPISGADYVLLGMVMWTVLGMVIAGIVPPKEGVVVIPEGTSIAEPMRRVIAGGIDFSLALLAVSRIQGVPLGDVLTLPWWSTESGQLVVIQALAALVVVCTVFECLLGRTPGKLVTGCEVLSTALKLEPGKKITESRPTVLKALLRNLLKWGLPPLGMLGVIDPSGRGRHDQYARTGVIVRYVPEDEPLDDDLDN